MHTFTQANRPLAITTPLGQDTLLLTGFHGYEAISQLFSFQVDLLAEVGTDIRFEKILGQKVTVALQLGVGEKRYFCGIVKSLSQGSRDSNFVQFRAQIVPQLWLLTKKVRSRIFPHLAVPDILRQVFTGLDVGYQLSGTYHPRDYCVQYRESDFDFASRLMEEEGIYYFFQHRTGTHQMIVSDSPKQHPPVPEPSRIIYDELSAGVRDDMRIKTWEKTQELRAGGYTLWDHCFELPGKNLEAKEKAADSVKVGTAIHHFNAGNDKLEIYEYPGGYAQRFDGIGSGGGAQPQDLKNISKDGARTVRIRMEQEETLGLRIEGTSDCSQFVPGHKFSLEQHFDADDDYLLTQVEHMVHLGEGSYRSDREASPFHYENRFTCIPVAVPYRPHRVTPKPAIGSVQTATVVGPAGEEIFCDKYGRVKVQFHWDRDGKKNGESSCWLRVAQMWAGNGWGAFFWPRIGHEVVVAFEDGDPDQPLIVGSVYNAQNMPPFSLPKLNSFSGIKSCSLGGSPSKNFNGVLFVDSSGHEHLAIHSERHLVMYAEYDKTFRAGRHQAERVPGARAVTVGGLPIGGGSGGEPNKNLFQAPEPTSFAGINSVVVYGGNFQIAIPLNMQLAYGTNLQICVNPATFGLSFPDGAVTPVSESAFQFLGSGLGGNMQITLGANAQVVLGQSITFNLGPQPLNFGAQAKAFTNPAVVKLGNIMNLMILIFLVAYTIPDDDFRSILLMAFQLGIQLVLFQMITLQNVYNTADDAQKDIYNQVHGTSGHMPGLDEFAGIASSLGIAAAMPVLLESLGEVQLDTSG